MFADTYMHNLTSLHRPTFDLFIESLKHWHYFLRHRDPPPLPRDLRAQRYQPDSASAGASPLHLSPELCGGEGGGEGQARLRVSVERLSRLRSASDEDYFVQLEVDSPRPQRLQTQARPFRGGRRRLVWNQTFEL